MNTLKFPPLILYCLFFFLPTLVFRHDICPDLIIFFRMGRAFYTPLLQPGLILFHNHPGKLFRNPMSNFKTSS